jgi:hypothetical protein
MLRVTKTVPASGAGPPFAKPIPRALTGFNIAGSEELDEKILT